MESAIEEKRPGLLMGICMVSSIKCKGVVSVYEKGRRQLGNECYELFDDGWQFERR